MRADSSDIAVIANDWLFIDGGEIWAHFGLKSTVSSAVWSRFQAKHTLFGVLNKCGRSTDNRY
jgi:hypothetical protein